MVSVEDYLNESGSRIGINWGRLATTLLGASVLAYFEGAAAAVLSLFDIPIGLLGGLASFSGEFLGLLVGFPAALIRSGWSGAVPYVLDAGLVGYVFAIALVLVSLYLAMAVIRRAR